MSNIQFEQSKGPYVIINSRGHAKELDACVYTHKINKVHSTLAKATAEAIRLSGINGKKYAVYECIGFVKNKDFVKKPKPVPAPPMEQ